MSRESDKPQQTAVEIRCPVGPQRMLAKILLEGGRPSYVEGNLIEFSCDDCKKTLRNRGQRVFRVLHRYDVVGVLVETVTEP